MCGSCGCSGQEDANTATGRGDARGRADRASDDATSDRVISLELDLLAKNDALAAANRRRLLAQRTLGLNLMSSPGAGKTTLLVATIEALVDRLPIGVVEGDQATNNDAARIRATGVSAIQVNTGQGCHLDARMIARALDHRIAPADGILFVENVGNLVCPAAFDLGEAARVVVVSVTEGEDKPLKYPGMFAVADLVLVTKCDLLPHLRFDVDALVANARRARPDVEVLTVGAQTGAGIDAWRAWIERARARLRDGSPRPGRARAAADVVEEG
ncbi:MAG: hydrogenase nickel incorporation protein HypB [Alphaproteobacteria bacterium]|jgi:hydrogenase nickel incorporation protein HypB|nr:hydrogenase nickel incorporation protein HypB [Alphaproteobacteria bacterium]